MVAMCIRWRRPRLTMLPLAAQVYALLFTLDLVGFLFVLFMLIFHAEGAIKGATGYERSHRQFKYVAFMNYVNDLELFFIISQRACGFTNEWF